MPKAIVTATRPDPNEVYVVWESTYLNRRKLQCFLKRLTFITMTKRLYLYLVKHKSLIQHLVQYIGGNNQYTMVYAIPAELLHQLLLTSSTICGLTSFHLLAKDKQCHWANYEIHRLRLSGC